MWISRSTDRALLCGARASSCDGGRPSPPSGGAPVNVVAVLWGAAMAVNLAWPRVEVYGPDGPLQYIAVIVVGVVVSTGLAWFTLRGRRRLGVLPEHARA